MSTEPTSEPATVTAGHSTFTLNSEYRAQLDTVAREQYAARDDGYDDRASELVCDLYDAPWGIGSGAGRVVIPLSPDAYEGGAYDEYVVKLAIPSCTPEWSGCEQTQREAAVWNNNIDQPVGADIRSFLVPVVTVGSDGYWIVMPRGDQLDRDSQEFREWKSSAEDDLRDIVWEDDLKKRNTVRLNGHYRLCDYGVPPE